MKKIYKFVISLAIPQLVGAVGSVFTVSSASDCYLTLEKPALNPPSWVFGPVWTTLFLLMGVALYFVWTADVPEKRKVYWVFGVQLFLNMLWSVVFFGLQNPTLAFGEILALIVLIVANILVFAKVSHRAAWLLVPYLLWVAFASYLNFSILRLN
jgi:translocator protein